MSAIESGTGHPTSYTTPTKRAAFISAEAGPSRPRPTGASPAYSSRRHSLYGIEDRVVLDLGSRVWKVGFSGEPEPRAVFFAQGTSSRDNTTEAWDLDQESVGGARGSRSEGNRLVEMRLVSKLRETFVKHLLADSKQRKVIVAENTYMPTYIKEHIARVLFDNLRVPSVSFTPSSVLSLASCGRITGLVVDVGWLETSVTPVYNSRPLFPLSRSTPIAGRRLHTRLKHLLRHHATFVSPSKSLGDLSRNQTLGVPPDVLTDSLVERVVTEGCFVGGVFIEHDSGEDVDMGDDKPVDAASHGGMEDPQLIHSLKARYQPSSTATDMTFSAPPPPKSTQMGYGSIIVPGWVRERAVEVLYEDDEFAEGESVHHAILNTLLRLPLDVRLELISSILVTGGVPSLPNFIPRLRISLLQSLLPPPTLPDDSLPLHSPLNTPAAHREAAQAWRKRASEPYKELYGLVDKVAILNDPAPIDGEMTGGQGGKAPRWVPSLMSWVGGSLAGTLRTGAPELTRETYDTLIASSLSRGEAYRESLEESYSDVAARVGVSVEELKVGEAVSDGRGLGRRRGWKDGLGVVADWSRSVKA